MASKTVKRFDIYWVDFNPTKGSEIQKTRPCVIISPDDMNQALKTVVVVPLTTTIIDWPFRTTVTIGSRRSSAACDQVRTIAKERLRRKAGVVTAVERRRLIDILQAMFSE